MNNCCICGYPIMPPGQAYGISMPVCMGHPTNCPPLQAGQYQFTPTPLTADEIRQIVREELERAKAR